VFHVFLFPGFLWFWGIVFLVTTTLVAVLKSEQAGGRGNDEEPDFGLRQSYSLLWDITRLPSIRKTMIVLLTSKVQFLHSKACNVL
jgi:PAT family acetyl-CoA transporter-like MFS transporter 1